MGTKQPKIVFSQRLAGEADAFQDGQVGEDVGNLEGTADSQMCCSMQGQLRNIAPLEDYLPTGWLEIAAQKIEKCCLAGPIGANYGM